MPKSAYLGNALINHSLRGIEYVKPDRLFVGLFLVSPDAVSLGSEVTAGEYIRTIVTMSPPQAKVTSNASAVTFPEALSPWGGIVAFGLFDAQIGGNLLYFGPFSTQKIVAAHDVLSFDVGQLVLVEN